MKHWRIFLSCLVLAATIKSLAGFKPSAVQEVSQAQKALINYQSKTFQAESVNRLLCKTWVYTHKTIQEQENRLRSVKKINLDQLEAFKIEQQTTFTYFDNGIFMHGNLNRDIEPLIMSYGSWRLINKDTLRKEYPVNNFVSYKIIKLTRDTLVLETVGSAQKIQEILINH